MKTGEGSALKIYLIRHGETEYNKEQRYQGSMDIPLSQEGRARLCAADFAPDRVYTSHLRRTRETAEILFPGVKLVCVRDLREMSFGDYEGRSKAELAGDPVYEQWLSTGFAGDCPDTEERHEEFVCRTCRAFSALVEEELARGSDRLVVVAHGGTQMAVLSSYVRESRPFGEWLTGNGEGYILETEHWKSSGVLTVAGKINCAK